MIITVLAVAALAVIAVPMSSMAAGDSIYIKGNRGLGIPLDSFCRAGIRWAKNDLNTLSLPLGDNIDFERKS